MKRISVLVLVLLIRISVSAQTANVIAGDHKVIDLGNNLVGDYTRSLILLHEIYNGTTTVGHNYAAGTIVGARGHANAYNRLNTVTVYSSSAYSSTSATLTANDDYSAVPWKFKTCIYQNKYYLALDIPYTASFHDHGFRFLGATKSTGENMKVVSYEVNGSPYNQSLISNIQDFNPNMQQTIAAQQLNITGNVGIGTSNPSEKLAVNGNIRAKEIKVETANWPDYVFSTDYQLPSLAETEQHIKDKGHLPGIPSAKEAEANGVELGEMNKKLLQKIEELTLHLLKQDKRIAELEKARKK